MCRDFQAGRWKAQALLHFLILVQVTCGPKAKLRGSCAQVVNL